MTDWYTSNDERLNYRDIELSRKLRTVGYCTDIDNLFCDFINLDQLRFRVQARQYHRYQTCDEKGSQQVIRYVAKDAEFQFCHIYCPGSSPDDPWVYNVIPTMT